MITVISLSITRRPNQCPYIQGQGHLRCGNVYIYDTNFVRSIIRDVLRHFIETMHEYSSPCDVVS